MTHTMTGAGWDRTRIEEITDAFHLAEPLEDDQRMVDAHYGDAAQLRALLADRDRLARDLKHVQGNLTRALADKQLLEQYRPVAVDLERSREALAETEREQSAVEHRLREVLAERDRLAGRAALEALGRDRPANTDLWAWALRLRHQIEAGDPVEEQECVLVEFRRQQWAAAYGWAAREFADSGGSFTDHPGASMLRRYAEQVEAGALTPWVAPSPEHHPAGAAELEVNDPTHKARDPEHSP